MPARVVTAAAASAPATSANAATDGGTHSARGMNLAASLGPYFGILPEVFMAWRFFARVAGAAVFPQGVHSLRSNFL